MPNKRQLDANLEKLAVYFAEKGKVLSLREYTDADDIPVSFSGIRRIFRSYSRMLVMLERNEPELFSMTQQESTQPDDTQAPADDSKTSALEALGKQDEEKTNE